MAKQDFIIKQQAVLSSDPASPPAGYSIIYPKSDGKWYSIDSAGTITEITNIPSGVTNPGGKLFNYYNFK